MTQFTLRGIQLALQVGHRTGLGRRRPPPSDGGDQLPPGIEKIGVDAQLLPDYRSGLAAIEPVCTASRLKEPFIVDPILCPSIRSNLTTDCASMKFKHYIQVRVS